MADETPTSDAPAPPPMKKWTVTMADGTRYPGVLAPSKEEAMRKMSQGAQGPLAPTPSYPEREKARVITGMEKVLTDAGRSPDEAAAEAARIGQKIPGSWGEVGGAIIPMLAGLIPAGRTVGKIAAPIAANILGRGALEAGLAATNNENPIAGGVAGATKGLLPGVVQAAVGALLGPSRDTARVQKMIEGVQSSVSPAVAKVLSVDEPAALLSRGAVRKMQKAASQTFAAAEGVLDANLSTFKFDLKGVPKTFAEMRAEITKLRDLGDRPYMTEFMAERAQKALRKAGQIERDMIDQLRRGNRQTDADRYAAAIEQYAKDSTAIRWVRGLHKQEALLGGANPQDFPGLAKAEAAIPSGKHPTTHAALGALEVATGRPGAAAWQLGRAAEAIKRGPLRPDAAPPSVLRRVLPGAAGAGTSGIQTGLLSRFTDDTPDPVQ